MKWPLLLVGVLASLACIGQAKPGGHITEERREYYQKTSKVIDNPVIYATDGGASQSYTDGASQSYTSSTTGSALASSWAQSHMEEIRKMADRLRSEYNYQATGGGNRGYHSRHGFGSSSSFDYPSFMGKSKEELDLLTRQMTEKMISDMKSGKLEYSQVVQPNWFESQAAQQLQALSQTQQGYGGIQAIGGGGYSRTSEKKHFEYSSSRHGGYQPIPTYATAVEDLNRRDEQSSSLSYPTTVTIIGGKRYVTKKNCSTSTSTQGAGTPYFPNYQSQSSFDRRAQANERNIPVVIAGQDQSTYEKSGSSYTKEQGQQTVPVYPGSYFTGDRYDSSQHSQTANQAIPQIQAQVQEQSSSDVRQTSQHQTQPYVIPIRGTQTIRTSSTTVRERDNQRVPIVIPTQQTVTSQSETFRQTENQRQNPVIYPSSSSTHRESSSYESHRQHEVPKPIVTTSHHSIYKHLEKEDESVPSYQPITTIDTQSMDRLDQQSNRYYPQQPATVVRGEETQHVEENRQVQQQNVVVPDLTLTIHQQENQEDIRDQRVHHVQPTIATSQQTLTDEQHQQSNVHYRPSYSAYGSQFNRNDTEYHEKFQTRYPQQQATGSTYENQEQTYTAKERQQVPIYGQTSQHTEETSGGETYRNQQQHTPVIVGGSSYQETKEEQFSEEERRRRPTYVGGSSQTSETEETYTAEGRQQVPIYGQTSQHTEETSGGETYRNQQQHTPVIVGGSSYQETKEEQYSEEERRRRPTYVGGSSQASETEQSYRESSNTRYPQGALVSQSTKEEETSDVNLQRRPGQPGYVVTTQYNETTSSSGTGSTQQSQQPIVVTSSQETTSVDVGSQEINQAVQRPTYTDVNVERNETLAETSSQTGQYPTGGSAGYDREQSQYEHEQHNQQRPYGGVQLEHSEYGSQVNRNYSSAGGNIGYVTHQLTIEQQEEEWRRQQEELRRLQLLNTGIVAESSLNTSSSYDNDGQIAINVHQQGIYDGDEDRNATIHVDETHYGTSADRTSTSASGKPPATIISKDRGDQPPHVYEEDYDMNESEPGIGPYPSEPEVANPEPTETPNYPPPYVAPLAPVDVDKEKYTHNQQTTVQVYPTTAGETEVQRTYHRKKTTITQTIPVLIGSDGQVIQQVGTSGGYQSQVSTSGAGSGNLSSEGGYTQQQAGGQQTYESSSNSQQSSQGQGSYGASGYGSQVEYSSNPSSVSSHLSGGTRYTTGSTSSSRSYKDGGSFSQASAYGHQQQDGSGSQHQGDQLTIGAYETSQQVQDLAADVDRAAGDVGQAVEDVQQNLEEFTGAQSQYGGHSSYSAGQTSQEYVDENEGQSAGSYYQRQSSYSSRASGGSSRTNSSSGSSSANNGAVAQALQADDAEDENQDKPGFWKRIGEKAKNIFG